MSFDRDMFVDKLKRCCEQFEVSREELSQETGIHIERLQKLEKKLADPSGDEVLIFADYFKCDFQYFISNERVASFDKTELLFRKYGDQLSKNDRWAIQEFLYLCECEEYLMEELGHNRKTFRFDKKGTYYKQHGQEAAAALRKHLGYNSNEVATNIYRDFIKIGFHVFRRKIEQSNISGICVRHPEVGPCLLVNYNEDVFRQRFSVAHEAGHGILDNEEDTIVSFEKWDKKDLVEIRANSFASNYLMPPEVLGKISSSDSWDAAKVKEWAGKLQVNIKPLIFALKENNIVSGPLSDQLLHSEISLNKFCDPEIPETLSPSCKERKLYLLERGLSDRYINLCFDAFDRKIISIGKLAEMLLMSKNELQEIAVMFNRSIDSGGI